MNPCMPVDAQDPMETSLEDSEEVVLYKAPSPKVITPLKDLLKAFVEARENIWDLDQAYDKQAIPIKEAKEAIQAEIISIFKEREEYTTRIAGITATLAVRKTAKISDEKALVKYLKEIGLNDYIEERVNELFIKSVLPEQGKLEKPFPGVIIQETEFLSARENNKVDARKITVKEFVRIDN